MSIINQLSSQIGDRTEESNIQVAEQCLADPSLLKEIAVGFSEKDDKLLGDCAEVMTMVAEKQPDYVAPFAEELFKLLPNKKPRVRWEAMHALALITPVIPEIIQPNLSQLLEMYKTDKSIIVRDCAAQLFCNYAISNPNNVKEIFDILITVCQLWEGRHSHHVFKGLEYAAHILPKEKNKIIQTLQPLLSAKKKIIQKKAQELLTIIQKL